MGGKILRTRLHFVKEKGRCFVEMLQNYPHWSGKKLKCRLVEKQGETMDDLSWASETRFPLRIYSKLCLTLDWPFYNEVMRWVFLRLGVPELHAAFRSTHLALLVRDTKEGCLPPSRTIPTSAPSPAPFCSQCSRTKENRRQ